MTAAERHHLTTVVRDIDTGTIGGETELPELMWVDERSKAALDQRRSYDTGYRLTRATREDLTQVLAREGLDLAHRDHGKLTSSVDMLTSTLDSVAHGGSLLGLDSDRKEFLTRRTRLGHNLRETGIGTDAMTALREVIDSRAREAGQAGQAAIARRDRWRERIDGIAAARDDALAQRQAAAAGHAGGPGRACAAAPALTTPTAGPTHSPHIRHLHGEEVGR